MQSPGGSADARPARQAADQSYGDAVVDGAELGVGVGVDEGVAVGVGVEVGVGVGVGVEVGVGVADGDAALGETDGVADAERDGAGDAVCPR